MSHRVTASSRVRAAFGALDPSLRADMQQLLLELRALLQPTITKRPCSWPTRSPSTSTVKYSGGGPPGKLVSGCHVSALGHFPVPQAEHMPDGPATLVIRQEAVRLVDPTSAAATVIGRVERMVSLGARSLVEVATTTGPLFAEAPPGQIFGSGDMVGMVFPTEQCVLLPDQVMCRGVRGSALLAGRRSNPGSRSRHPAPESTWAER